MNYYISLFIIILIYMSMWFLYSLIKKRNDIADIGWGLGFIVIAWISFYLSVIQSNRGILVGILISIWGLRLSWHIYSRNKNKKEDYRYLDWRNKWGKWFYLRSFFQIYILQGVLLFIISIPILMINKSPEISLGLVDFIGVLIWIFGFYFESIGDRQLAKFIKNPANKGKIMTAGLWSYTRHPNYFGEVTQWWGIYIIALSIENGWVAIIGPITITFLILKVSGIPMLEKKMENNSDFAEYKKRVRAFFPLPKK